MSGNDNVTRYFGYVIISVFIVTLTILVHFGWTNSTFNNLVVYQFKVIVLIPVSALFSFVLISLFQSISGNIEFNVLGFEFKGASGPIIMWVFSFLAIVFSINYLWDDMKIEDYQKIFA